MILSPKVDLSNRGRGRYPEAEAGSGAKENGVSKYVLPGTTTDCSSAELTSQIKERNESTSFMLGNKNDFE